MDIFELRAEDFNSAQQRQIYLQLRERANTRLKRARRRQEEIFANKRASQFLKRKNYRFFPKKVSDKELDTYLNEMLTYLQDRTSLHAGIEEVKEERLTKLMRVNPFTGVGLVTGGNADELDTLLRSEEWDFFKANFDYELIFEDFSDEMNKGRSIESFLEDMRSFRKRMEDSTGVETQDILYSDFRKEIGN